MRLHVVISKFRHGAGYVSPEEPAQGQVTKPRPTTWLPPDQGTADRLIAAKCLREMTGDEVALLAETEKDAEVEKDAEAEKPAKQRARGGRGRRG